MTEDEFRKKMKELGWNDEYIENKINKRNAFIKSTGVEPPPLDIYVGRPPEIEHFH
ncbi:MAG: hypothetical protein J6I55_10365 [Ruminococcus sp.]|nr:hypothetical protein [Ruminococcus sp.]